MSPLFHGGTFARKTNIRRKVITGERIGLPSTDNSVRPGLDLVQLEANKRSDALNFGARHPKTR